MTFFFHFYDFAFYDFGMCCILILRPIILVGSEPVWLPTYAFAYFSFACFELCVSF